MKLFRLSRFSIRTRLIIGMEFMILQMILLGISALLFLHYDTNILAGVAREAIDEMDPVMHLQVRIQNAAMPPNDYLVSGNPAEREEFARLSREVDQAMEKTLAAPFVLKEERDSVLASREEWRLAKGGALSLLAIPNPVGDQAAGREMKKMDAHFRKTVALLGEIHEYAHREIKEDLEDARTFHRRALILFVSICIAGSAISTVLALALVRSILISLRILERGAEHLGSGDLSHRVILDNDDELARVAKTFNIMAGNLEKNQEILKNISIRDGLTQLYNHREFQKRLKEEMERSLRYSRPLSLLMLDIDHFKIVNDIYGHPVGDRVLQTVSARILDNIRPTDQPARYGGEEFAVILPETPLSGASIMAERIRRVIADLAIPLGEGEPINITVSIGMATFPEDAASEQELIAAADRSLYAAKQAGRNRVSHLSGRQSPLP